MKSFFENSTLVFDAPIAISQISFDKKEPVLNHILMIGDSAGLIHPLCGNGMAMAIHSAKIAADLLTAQRNESFSRSVLEKKYTHHWKLAFQRRLTIGRWIQNGLQHKKITRLGVSVISKSPYLLKSIIKSTHGKPIV